MIKKYERTVISSAGNGLDGRSLPYEDPVN